MKLYNTFVTSSKNVANGFLFVLEVACLYHNSTVGLPQILCCLIPEYVCKMYSANEDLQCTTLILVEK